MFWREKWMKLRIKHESESTGTFITYSSMDANIQTFSCGNYYLWLHFVAFAYIYVEGEKVWRSKACGKHTKTLLFIRCMEFEHIQITLIKNLMLVMKNADRAKKAMHRACRRECVQIFDKAWMCFVYNLCICIANKKSVSNHVMQKPKTMTNIPFDLIGNRCSVQFVFCYAVFGIFVFFLFWLYACSYLDISCVCKNRENEIRFEFRSAVAVVL